MNKTNWVGLVQFGLVLARRPSALSVLHRRIYNEKLLAHAARDGRWKYNAHFVSPAFTHKLGIHNLLTFVINKQFVIYAHVI